MTDRQDTTTEAITTLTEALRTGAPRRDRSVYKPILEDDEDQE